MAYTYSLVRSSSGPPVNAVKLAWRHDIPGPIYVAVAYTEWGHIPGKSRTDTCWFPYAGKEHSTKNFSWLVAEKDAIWLWKNDGSGPPYAGLAIGHQEIDNHKQYAVIARTSIGSVPGKAEGQTCWYGMNGKEHTTKEFDWLVSADVGFTLMKNPSPLTNAVQLGFQTDGQGDMWNVVSHTSRGHIPGKSTGKGCCFPAQGREHHTDDFSWIVTKKDCSFLEISEGSGPPTGAIKIDQPKRAMPPLYAAVAKTNRGLIPGKVRDNTCWYPYNNHEQQTSDFFWVVSWKIDVPSPIATGRQEGILRIPHDSCKSDVIIQTPPYGGQVVCVADRRTWRLCVTLIGMWDWDRAPTTPGQIDFLCEMTVDNQREIVDSRGGKRANVVLRQGANVFANAIIQLGPIFGRQMIRRCFIESLQNQTVATLLQETQ